VQDAPPLLPDDGPLPNDWSPFNSRVEFETAEFMYCRNQMSAGNIDTLLELWAASLIQFDGTPPFANHCDLYKTIDNIRVGGVPWNSFPVHYEGDVPATELPSWMVADVEVWYCDPHEVIKNVLANTDFDGEMDVAPFREYNTDGEQQYQNLMSGDWAWNQAVRGIAALMSGGN
jgi:hypothetical protein